MSKVTTLPEDYALVLQQIDEDGGDDFNTLEETLRFGRPRLAHIIQALQHKGLITLQRGAGGAWIRLSRKGDRLLRYLWPESRGLPAGL